MARKGNISFVPTSNKGGPGTLLIDLIPMDVRREVEEVYFSLKSADGRMHVEYDTPEEVIEYRRQVESYCKNRPVNPDTIREYFTGEDMTQYPTGLLESITGGPLRFRQSPVKSQPKTEMDYRITDIPAPDKDAEKIRDATAAVIAETNPTDENPTRLQVGSEGADTDETATQEAPAEVTPTPTNKTTGSSRRK